MREDRAATFLQMIRRSRRGRLKVYLGYAAGVGKTYQMLLEGHRLVADEIDAVVGYVEAHGRQETEALVSGLEVVPRHLMEYHGIIVEEMDLDGVLARRPEVALVDELAHTNAPDSRNAKRYQDVQELLAAGIHVITTLNLQHLESLYDTVEKLVGVKVRERLPDAVIADADQIVNVDLTTEDLQRRLREGRVYPADRATQALEHFFTTANLQHLRELTLRELAAQIDLKRREILDPEDRFLPDQVMVCLSSRGPNSARLLRAASRLAGRLNRNWYALYVQTPAEEPTAIDPVTQRLLADTLTLANQLGAVVFTFKGENVVDTIRRFAREYRIGHIVIGRSPPLSWWQRARGRRSFAEELVERTPGVTVVVVDVQEAPPGNDAPPERPEWPAGSAIRLRSSRPGLLANRLGPEHIIIWENPATRDEILRRLVASLAAASPRIDEEAALVAVQAREAEGSTFLNEGVALPHARLENLVEPLLALGVTKAGVLDTPAETPIRFVLLLLSPAANAPAHLQVLAAAARMLRGLDFQGCAARAHSPAQVLAVLAEHEGSSPQDIA
ncbi:MAG: PTS sugar transporter subunit IIA [Candidatus Schekmanbacteria bacterium]|nr:PTS sugar transporter subunit IIA [Candidatus Schekmanbacteria bacterium]